MGEAVAEAKGNWTTEEFVPFEATLRFDAATQEASDDTPPPATLRLEKANASGRAENTAVVAPPVRYLE